MNDRPKLTIAQADLNVDQRLVYLYDQVKKLRAPTITPVVINGGGVGADATNEMSWRGVVSLRTHPSVNVPGTSKPWNFVVGGLNTNLQFANSAGGGGTAPVVVDALLRAGDVVTVTYVSGTVSIGTGQPFTDAGGSTVFPGGSNNPTAYCPYLALVGVNGCTLAPYSVANPAPSLGAGGLCGSFVDDTGKVIGAIAVGNGGNFIVPSGATTLQLGIADDAGDNSGSFVVSVQIHSGALPSYAVGDVIVFESAPYVCVAPNPNGVLPPNFVYWTALNQTVVPGGVYPALSPPSLTNFVWVNQLDRTASTQSNRLTFTVPPHPDPNVSLLAASASLPAHHQIDGAFAHGGSQNSASIQDFQGIGIRDSVSGKFITFYIRVNGTTTTLYVVQWNSVTAVNIVPFTNTWGVATPLNFFRITDNGVTRSYLYSMNGWDYVTVFSEATGTFITPNQAVIGGFNSATVTVSGACWNWSITAI